MRVAYLGLGIMGGGMAANLVKAGHEVTVWNRTPKVPPDGARAAVSPRAAAAEAEVVWLCVSDTEAVRQVLFGDQGVEASLRPGMTVVDSSTISPAASREFAARVQEKGASFVDAPVTGSKVAAASGQLIFMTGGDEKIIGQLQPLFQAMGKQVSRMGGIGMGVSAKLAMNLMIALTYEGFAEGLILAKKLGVEPELLVPLIQSSMVRSGVVDYKAPFVLTRDFTPNFPLRLMQKDIKLMLEAAKEANVKLPALETVEGIYQQAQADKDEDYAATIKVLENWAGMKVKEGN